MCERKTTIFDEKLPFFSRFTRSTPGFHGFFPPSHQLNHHVSPCFIVKTCYFTTILPPFFMLKSYFTTICHHFFQGFPCHGWFPCHVFFSSSAAPRHRLPDAEEPAQRGGCGRRGNSAGTRRQFHCEKQKNIDGYIYVRIYLYIYKHTCIYIYIYTQLHTHIYIYLYIYIYVYIYRFTYDYNMVVIWL